MTKYRDPRQTREGVWYFVATFILLRHKGIGKRGDSEMKMAR